METRGVILFEEFCARMSMHFKRIPEESGKTPDYFLCANGCDLFVEVKTMFPRRQGSSLRIEGGVPGERLRRLVKEANRQFKAVVGKDRVPTLLVVCNNTGSTIDTDPYAIMTTMLGVDEIDVHFEQCSLFAPTFGRVVSGKGKCMRPDCNTSTSAVATVHDWGGGVQLKVYHNRHAAIPLPIEALGFDCVQQMRLPDDTSNCLETRWIAVG